MTNPMQRLQHLMDTFPQRLAEAQDRVAHIAEESVTGTDADESVTVTADGAGQIRDVTFDILALRQADNYTLGERITEATNAALVASESLRGSLLAQEGPSLDEAQEMFNARMDGLLERLDHIDRSLDV